MAEADEVVRMEVTLDELELMALADQASDKFAARVKQNLGAGSTPAAPTGSPSAPSGTPRSSSPRTPAAAANIQADIIARNVTGHVNRLLSQAFGVNLGATGKINRMISQAISPTGRAVQSATSAPAAKVSSAVSGKPITITSEEQAKADKFFAGLGAKATAERARITKEITGALKNGFVDIVKSENMAAAFRTIGSKMGLRIGQFADTKGGGGLVQSASVSEGAGAAEAGGGAVIAGAGGAAAGGEAAAGGAGAAAATGPAAPIIIAGVLVAAALTVAGKKVANKLDEMVGTFGKWNPAIRGELAVLTIQQRLLNIQLGQKLSPLLVRWVKIQEQVVGIFGKIANKVAGPIADSGVKLLNVIGHIIEITWQWDRAIWHFISGSWKVLNSVINSSTFQWASGIRVVTTLFTILEKVGVAFEKCIYAVSQFVLFLNEFVAHPFDTAKAIAAGTYKMPSGPDFLNPNKNGATVGISNRIASAFQWATSQGANLGGDSDLQKWNRSFLESMKQAGPNTATRPKSGGDGTDLSGKARGPFARWLAARNAVAQARSDAGLPPDQGVAYGNVLRPVPDIALTQQSANDTDTDMENARDALQAALRGGPTYKDRDKLRNAFLSARAKNIAAKIALRKAKEAHAHDPDSVHEGDINLPTTKVLSSNATYKAPVARISVFDLQVTNEFKIQHESMMNQVVNDVRRGLFNSMEACKQEVSLLGSQMVGRNLVNQM